MISFFFPSASLNVRKTIDQEASEEKMVSGLEIIFVVFWQRIWLLFVLSKKTCLRLN